MHWACYWSLRCGAPQKKRMIPTLGALYIVSRSNSIGVTQGPVLHRRSGNYNPTSNDEIEEYTGEFKGGEPISGSNLAEVVWTYRWRFRQSRIRTVPPVFTQGMMIDSDPI